MCRKSNARVRPGGFLPPPPYKMGSQNTPYKLGLTFLGVRVRDKMAISAYILKIVEKNLFLRLQMRAKEDFNRHQLFPQNKQ